MESNEMINVKSELDMMNQYITDIEQCTANVREVTRCARAYQSNIKINLLTIAATVYALASLILRMNIVLWGIGVVLIGILIFLYKSNDSIRCNVSSILNIVVIVSSTIFFLIMIPIIPLLALLVDWICTVLCNNNVKNQTKNILSNL